MPTTVRVEDEVKLALDQLQGHLQSETGERMSHSELLRRLLAVARRHETELLERDAGKWRPPTAQQMDVLLGGARGVDVATDSSRIDEDLYGEREP